MNYDKSKIVKGMFGEEMVLRELKTIFGEEALFFQNILIPSKSNSDKAFECDIICVSCKGIFVFEVKNWEGHIEANMLSQKWGFRSKNSNSYIQLDNPILQNEIHRNVLRDLLGEQVVSIVVLNDIHNNFSINRYSEELVNVPVLLTTELSNYFSNHYQEDVCSNQQLFSLFSKLSNMKNDSDRMKEEKLNLTKNNTENIVDKSNEFQNSIQIKTSKETNPSCSVQELKQAKFNSKKENYRVGDSVKHNSFGIGTIISVQPMGRDMLLKVSFEKSGTKALMANGAQLEKIEQQSISPQNTSSSSQNISFQKRHYNKRQLRIVKIISAFLLCVVLVCSITAVLLEKGTLQNIKETIKEQTAIPEIIENRRQYSIDELAEMPVVKTEPYKDNNMKLRQSLLYRTETVEYVSNYQNKTRTAKLYITPVEYIKGKNAQEYYDYLNKKYLLKRPLRSADNEEYVVVRLYVWYKNDKIPTIDFNKERYKESISRKNGIIKFFVDGDSEFYWSNETNGQEYIGGYYVEDLNNNAIKNSTVSSGTPIEVIYLIPVSKDLDYTIIINPHYYNYSTDRARLKLSK